MLNGIGSFISGLFEKDKPINAFVKQNNTTVNDIVTGNQTIFERYSDGANRLSEVLDNASKDMFINGHRVTDINRDGEINYKDVKNEKFNNGDIVTFGKEPSMMGEAWEGSWLQSMFGYEDSWLQDQIVGSSLKKPEASEHKGSETKIVILNPGKGAKGSHRAAQDETRGFWERAGDWLSEIWENKEPASQQHYNDR